MESGRAWKLEVCTGDGIFGKGASSRKRLQHNADHTTHCSFAHHGTRSPTNNNHATWFLATILYYATQAFRS